MSSYPARCDVICAGVLAADLFVPPLARLPMAGELVATQDFLADSGGCAANTATALVKLGVRAVVAGKVGNDIFGDFIIRDLQRKTVDISGISRSTNHGTSKTVILPVTGEDRRYIHTLGANADFAGSDLAPCLSDRSRVLYLGSVLKEGFLPLVKQRGMELVPPEPNFSNSV
jgi:sugar/nucleoside kinase (ribokinase family)